jgi:3-methyladenine DNA glycosylase AlkD
LDIGMNTQIFSARAATAGYAVELMAQSGSAASTADRVHDVLAWLERRGTRRHREALTRYGIHAPKAFGVSMSEMQSLARPLGRNHELALGLWDTGWYEARTMSAFVAEPARVTASLMDRWARDFDNWAICDTLCFKLFDQTPHAWRKVDQWSRRREEFVKRAAFALLASLALHDKPAADEKFLRTLPLIEAAATDDRNFVKKGVSWALRSIGHRNVALHDAALRIADRLSASPVASARWVGNDARRDLTRALVQRRLAAKQASGARRQAPNARPQMSGPKPQARASISRRR